MRRAERLFQLVQLIRGRRLSTARFLAGRLEVSERTVYRDVADLQAQGVPIEGEAGVGCRMRSGFDLPPLMFSHDEARALVAAVQPLACLYRSEVWTLAAWCELRRDFRHFRVDRIEALAVLDERFRDKPGRTLADLFREVEGGIGGAV
ncbi:MAG: HTH domain-containing protein [Rhizobacter sp.]|nr:HTH domain-containing protein [Rhizobacter sp.]